MMPMIVMIVVVNDRIQERGNNLADSDDSDDISGNCSNGTW